MAVNGSTSMISPPSSVSNGPEPSQLPPYPPPLRSGQVLQPLSVFTGIELNSASPDSLKYGFYFEIKRHFAHYFVCLYIVFVF